MRQSLSLFISPYISLHLYTSLSLFQRVSLSLYRQMLYLFATFEIFEHFRNYLAHLNKDRDRERNVHCNNQLGVCRYFRILHMTLLRAHIFVSLIELRLSFFMKTKYYIFIYKLYCKMLSPAAFVSPHQGSLSLTFAHNVISNIA